MISALVCAAAMMAAPATPTYFCDFEDAAENAEWITWPGTTASRMKHSTWKTGTAAFYTGQKGLYVYDPEVSADNTHNSLKSGGFSVTAYRKMTLAAGTYTISLDYKCPTDLLSVSLVHADTLENADIQTQTGSAYSAPINTALLPGLTDMKAQQWMHGVATQRVATAGTYLLAITYRSSGADLPFAAAVDNVEVVLNQTDQTACDYQLKDVQLNLVNGFAELSWKGNADNYEVRYFNADGQVVVLDVVPDNGAIDSCRIALAEMADGVYSFMVRGLGCGGNDAKTGWAYVRNKLIYDPAEHCIDYLNFDGRGVVCKYGAADWSSTSESERITSTTTGYLDFGYASQNTTHTIHFKPNETDYMTNGQLRTVPAGEVASVRLGSREPDNGYPGGHWQSISYTVHITEDMGVLLFRYAYVGQTGGHTGLDQSHIRLKLTDQQGNIINGADCGSVLFYSPKDDAEMNMLNRNPKTAGWHKGRKDSGEGLICEDYVYWRDWTTVGINVQQYAGEDIKIEVSNFGCSASCHYGYCYFTLDCSKGAIQGATCDEKPRSLKVDEGFDYRWYKPYNPGEPFYEGQDPTSDSLYISVQDTNTYYVDLMRKGNNTCYFTLHAAAIKRIPEAKVSFQHTPVDCQNFVTPTNESGVYGYYPTDSGVDSVARSYGNLAKEKYEWTTASGASGVFGIDDFAPIPVSNAGDTITMHAVVTMDEGCIDEREIVYYVPAIGPNVGRDTIYTVYGDSVEFQGEWYAEEGDYELVLKNWMGCDSTLSLHVDYLKSETFLTVDTICQGQKYQFVTYAGRRFEVNKTGVYRDTCRSVVLDSDSLIFVLDLTVLDTLVVKPSKTACTLCADTASVTIDYTVVQGITDSCILAFDATNPSQISPVTLTGLGTSGTITVPIDPADGSYRRPGLYTAKLTFFDKNGCADQSCALTFDVLFPSNIIFQRWDDVLSVKNEEFNGGYTFSAYQWLQNGADLQEQTKSYYFAPEKLDTQSIYQVRLTDAAGLSLLSCPFVPKEYTGGMNVSPRNVSRGQQVVVSTPERAHVRFYNVSGLLLLATTVEAGSTLVEVPSETGMCIVQLTTESEARSFRLQITE